MVKKRQAPKHLAKPTADWWDAVVTDWTLDEHHKRLLTAAAECWDRLQEAREALQKYGTVYVDRFGQPRARPEVAIERDSRLHFARLLRELDLDAEAAPDRSRPPRRGR